MRLRPLQPIGRKGKPKDEAGAIPHTKDCNAQGYVKADKLDGIDDVVEMNIRPLPESWNDDCVWIRKGKTEKKVKRANLAKYEGWEVVNHKEL